MGILLAMSLLLFGCGQGGSHSPAHDHGDGHAHEEGDEHAHGAQEPASDDDLIQAQIADYPMKVCVVSDEALGSMGDPYDIVHDGRLVRFCCKGCIDDFNADPDKFLAKLDAASETNENSTTE